MVNLVPTGRILAPHEPVQGSERRRIKMANGGPKSFLGMILAIISFVIAILMFTAKLLPQDPLAGKILGFLFIGIGILWVVRYSQKKSKTE